MNEKNDTIIIDGVVLYYGPLELIPEVCEMPSSEDEARQLLDASSNWMKLFKTYESLSTSSLKKILFLEICGRRRPDMVNRVRALIETRNRNRNIEEVDIMWLDVLERKQKCESA